MLQVPLKLFRTVIQHCKGGNDKLATIKNSFNTTVSGTSLTTHTIVGLSSVDSEKKVTLVNAESSLYFLKSLYQTIVDAGYTDVIIDETNFSITVLGFKFFSLVTSASSTLLQTLVRIYTYPNIEFCTTSFSGTGSTYNKYHAINDYGNSGSELSFNITVRGDENCIQICYSPYLYPNADLPIIFIAKSRNLITSEDAFFYSPYIHSNVASYFRDKSNLYASVSATVNSTSANSMLMTYSGKGLNTNNKIVCEPITGYDGTYLIYSLIKCNINQFERGKYYRIGDDLYYCYATYSYSGTLNTKSAHFLFKVS